MVCGFTKSDRDAPNVAITLSMRHRCSVFRIQTIAPRPTLKSKTRPYTRMHTMDTFVLVGKIDLPEGCVVSSSAPISFPRTEARHDAPMYIQYI